MKRSAPSPAPCPCGSSLGYAACCQPLHQGLAAPGAEALMRSRYTAYVLGLTAYLMATWHPSTRPESLDLNETPAPQWLGLTLKAHQQQSDTRATVEFVARYRVQGKAHRLHETSRFVLENGQWYYVDGEILTA